MTDEIDRLRADLKAMMEHALKLDVSNDDYQAELEALRADNKALREQLAAAWAETHAKDCELAEANAIIHGMQDGSLARDQMGVIERANARIAELEDRCAVWNAMAGARGLHDPEQVAIQLDEDAERISDLQSELRVMTRSRDHEALVAGNQNAIGNAAEARAERAEARITELENACKEWQGAFEVEKGDHSEDFARAERAEAERKALREALEIIAGTCVDNLLGNQDIARAALNPNG